MSQYWFKPKTYGYGATPSGWKGWAAVAIYVASILALTLPLLAWPADMPVSPRIWQLMTWAILAVLLTLGFIRLRGRRPMDNGPGVGESRVNAYGKMSGRGQPGREGGGVNVRGATGRLGRPAGLSEETANA